jgi:hypothetical protein
MTEIEIINKLNDIRDYISSPYFHPDQAKTIYEERQRLEKMLDDERKENQRFSG